MDSVAGRAGEPMKVLPWQRHVIERIYARDPTTGRRRHRRALIGMARKNGKTGFAAHLALHGLVAEGEGAQVYSCAADRDQAKLVFTAAKRMVEMSPELRGICKVSRDVIEYTETGSIYRALSSEAYTKEGLSPTLVIMDELHALPDRDLYDVMSLAMGARIDPLMVIVTTAGVRVDRFGQDTIAYQLYQLGKRIATGEVIDPTYYMAWWESAEGSAPDDESAWRDANPGLDDILDPADMRSALPPATPQNEYLTKRHNRWVTTAKSWLPFGAWDACAKPDRQVTPDEPVVLGFDGSWTNDSTALVGCTVDDPHVFVVKVWERPLDAASWVVPKHEVDAALEQAMSDYHVVEVTGDPSYWRDHFDQWRDRGWPVDDFPNTVPRMVTACRAFYTAVVERHLTHSAEPVLARHIDNATIKEDQAGTRIVKLARGAKIDLAVASLMAYDRAHARKAGDVVQFINFGTD